MADLSNHLAAEGQWGEALAAIKEAVTIRRQLAGGERLCGVAARQ